MCFLANAVQTKKLYRAMQQRKGEVLFYKGISKGRLSGTDYALSGNQSYRKGNIVHAHIKLPMIKKDCPMEAGIYVFLSRGAVNRYNYYAPSDTLLEIIEVAAKAEDLIGYVYYDLIDQRACFRKVRVLS